MRAARRHTGKLRDRDRGRIGEKPDIVVQERPLPRLPGRRTMESRSAPRPSLDRMAAPRGKDAARATTARSAGTATRARAGSGRSTSPRSGTTGRASSRTKVITPDEREFVSATPEAHRKGEKAYHVKAFRGSKEGYLFLLSTGILFGFKKPLLFFAFANIESVSYTSILQRTFNLNIMARPMTSDETQEIEFSMIDQADFAGIDGYIKKHGLQDTATRTLPHGVNTNILPTLRHIATQEGFRALFRALFPEHCGSGWVVLCFWVLLRRESKCWRQEGSVETTIEELHCTL